MTNKKLFFQFFHVDKEDTDWKQIPIDTKLPAIRKRGRQWKKNGRVIAEGIFTERKDFHFFNFSSRY